MKSSETVPVLGETPALCFRIIRRSHPREQHFGSVLELDRALAGLTNRHATRLTVFFSEQL